ncbi:hypothetical protein BJ912DRAFT_668341 [Pholiota molesta]|nr:hypothetical protein BJ912DRAFT_668341 [Pholiota molesta]
MVKIREEFTELSERTAQNLDQIVVDMDNLPGLEHYLQMPDLPVPAAPITAAEFAAITQFVARGPGHIAPFTNTTAFNPAMQTNQTAPHTGDQNIIRSHRRQPSQSTSDLISVVAPWIPQGYQPVAGPSNPPGLAPWIPQGYQPVAGPSNPPGRMHRYPSFQENYLPFAGGESAYTPDEYAASINSEHSSENSTTGLLRRHSKATRK